MKDEQLTLEAEIVEKTAITSPMGIAFNHANTVKVVSMEAQPAFGLRDGKAGAWPGFREFVKPTLSNLFLLGCLIGLFVLYCCSCVIHALTFPARRKSS